jgi:hypothetical protein
MSSSREPDFIERRNAAANAKKVAVEKFRANAADPSFAERQTARTTRAAGRAVARQARETEKAEIKVRGAELATAARRDAEAQAERALAEKAHRELVMQAERKTARDARYAARKARSKRR